MAKKTQMKRLDKRPSISGFFVSGGDALAPAMLRVAHSRWCACEAVEALRTRSLRQDILRRIRLKQPRPYPHLECTSSREGRDTGR